jgi:cytoskeletal protein CcmA (bactofilin family)
MLFGKRLYGGAGRGVLTRRGVRIIGARFAERVDLVNAELKHELWLNDCLLEQGADFTGARSTRLLSFDRSKVTGEFTANWSRIDQPLNMRDAQFGKVVLGSAHLGDTLALGGSKVSGQLNMDKLHVDSSLFMGNAQLGEVVLASAHIGGTLTLDGSTVSGQLNMDKLQVDSSLFMGNAQLGKVVLASAHIGGTLALGGSKVSGQLNMDKLHVDSSLDMSHAHFGAVVLRSAHIAGPLTLDGSTVSGQLNMDKLHVDLLLRPADQHSAQWSPHKTLILRNARAETIPMLTDAWPDHVDVGGFTYRSLREDSGASHDRTTECRSDVFQCWFEKQKSFSPQPYEQLAVVFQNQGRDDEARDIRYAGRERERSESGGPRYAWLTTLDWAIGYGHRIERALGWTIGLIFLGAIVLRISGEGPKHGLPVGLSYSFDMLLPIIKLRDAHYEIDLKGWPRYYFYVHKVAGFVLASFLVAGISGLTK